MSESLKIQGVTVDCDEGWWPIVIQLDIALTKLDPNYMIVQIKERFGELRYYFYSESDSETYAKMHALVDDTRQKSLQLCEACGKPPWRRWRGRSETLCSEHKDERAKKRARVLVG